eukprot:scaffold146645_cov17-Tisochrysis_lutea.AAC.1
MLLVRSSALAVAFIWTRITIPHISPYANHQSPYHAYHHVHVTNHEGSAIAMFVYWRLYLFLHFSPACKSFLRAPRGPVGALEQK